MLFIKLYFYFFYTFVYTLVGICEAIGYLNRMQFSWPKRRQARFRDWAAMLHLDFGKVH
ncbi:hypothetical protein HRH25_09590 [Flavisolibacter sp. BT320]|nr:hypothetical protein [Flavisolibacter longurius]